MDGRHLLDPGATERRLGDRVAVTPLFAFAWRRSERGTWWGAFGRHRALPETLPQVVRALEELDLSVLGRCVRIPLSRRGLC